MSDELLSTLLSEAKHDYIGLWEVTKKVRLLNPNLPPDAVRSRTLQLVTEMLTNGFLAVDLLPSGGCQPWENQNLPEILECIEAKWRELGREPNIGDVVWFSTKQKLD
jgi:hypothetical protein